MILELHFIYGFMFGFEYVDDDGIKYYVLDLGIVRLMLASPQDQHFMAALKWAVFFNAYFCTFTCILSTIMHIYALIVINTAHL